MKAPSEEIYSKSTAYDFLLMASSKHVRITYRLRDILAFESTLNSPIVPYRIENHHFRPPYCDCRPSSGGTLNSINVIYASLKSTFSGLQLEQAVQVHPSSSILVPARSAYATSY